MLQSITFAITFLMLHLVYLVHHATNLNTVTLSDVLQKCRVLTNLCSVVYADESAVNLEIMIFQNDNAEENWPLIIFYLTSYNWLSRFSGSYSELYFAQSTSLAR